MGAYRLYLLDAKGAIQARQDFVTDSDTEAMTTGSLLWRSCADCYPGYELWEGPRRLAREHNDDAPVSPPPIDGIAPHLQERLLTLQEILLGSHWRAAQSVALIAATEALRLSLDGHRTAALTHQDMMRYIGAATGSLMMSLQMTEGALLRLRGSRGFDGSFDEYFAVVDCGDCACGAAFTNRRQTIVPAINSSPIYAGQRSLDVLRAQGVASCVSTPVLGGDGRVTGMFSILRRYIWHPADGELAQLQHIATDIAAAMADPFSAAAQRVRARA